MGHATPARIDAHVDPKISVHRKHQPSVPTGVNYLGALSADHAATLRAGCPPGSTSRPSPSP